MEETQNTKRRPRLQTTSIATSGMDFQDRIPPQAPDLEAVVLGGMMLERDALNNVIDILSTETFYEIKHQKIFNAIKTLFGKSEPVDILTVTNQLRSDGVLDEVGGAYYISQLTNRVVSGANIEFHARILLQKFIQRELIKISSETIHDAYDETIDVFDLLDNAESRLFNIGNNMRRGFETMPDLVEQALKEIESIKDNKDKSGIRGVPSGYTELDRITQGWQKSDLIILAARPGMGKTAFALNLARNAAVQFNRPVAFFSLEMSSVQLVTRLISSETSITSGKLRAGDLTSYEWEWLHSKVSPLINAKILIDDTPQLSIFDLRAKCRRLQQQYHIEMVFIDYLQLMTAKGDNKGNREQEISNISRSLKSLAKELEIPVLTLSQLSRNVENRVGSKKPQLSDLRESGAIEQDADMVLFIYRPEYYGLEADNGKDAQGQAIINIAKHRNGKLGDVELKFIGQYARFEEPDVDYSQNNQMKPNQSFETRSSKMNDMDDIDVFPSPNDNNNEVF